MRDKYGTVVYFNWLNIDEKDAFDLNSEHPKSLTSHSTTLLYNTEFE